MPMSKSVSTKKANLGSKFRAKVRVPQSLPNWELAIADAEEQIVHLRRSIEMFKHNMKLGIPFPTSATKN